MSANQTNSIYGHLVENFEFSVFFFFVPPKIENMNKSYFLLIIMLCVFCVNCLSKSIKTQKLANFVVDMAADSTKKKNCDELPKMILAELLGEAYNSRYMSINRPLSEDEVRLIANNPNGYTLSKRTVDNMPSFYVEEKHSIELSEKAAWDQRVHIDDTESQLSQRRRRKRAISLVNEKRILPANELPQKTVAENADDEHGQSMAATTTTTTTLTTNANSSTRFRRAYERRSDMSTPKNRGHAWTCDVAIKWVNLGPDFFPQYLRTVECVQKHCYYKLAVCKPKAFAIKVLRRRKGVCADAANLRKSSSFEFHSAFAELWKWEEVAVNFCCDCSVL